MTFDNNGNLTGITDASGTTIYTWNARNQLASMTGPSVSASFIYDGLGRREKKTVNSSLTEFLYDGVNPVQETSGVTVLGNILTGLGIDEFLSRTDVAAGATSHFLPDGLGSTIALADAAGAVQTEYTYEPFGKTTPSGASNTNPFQYTGRENDGTGLYYYRARYYHPALQRFASEDPYLHPTFGKCANAVAIQAVQNLTVIGAANPQNLNAYGYTVNSPSNLRDPLGLAWWYICPQPPPGCSFVGVDPVFTPLPDYFCFYDPAFGRVRCIVGIRLRCAYTRCFYNCRWPGRKGEPEEKQLELIRRCENWEEV